MFSGEDNSWTNRKSTAVEPLLTAPPLEALDKAHNILTGCAAVASVTILDENDQKITLAQAKAIDFIPLDELAEAAANDDSDVDEVAEAVVELKDAVAQQQEQIGTLEAKQARCVPLKPAIPPPSMRARHTHTHFCRPASRRVPRWRSRRSKRRWPSCSRRSTRSLRPRRPRRPPRRWSR